MHPKYLFYLGITLLLFWTAPAHALEVRLNGNRISIHADQVPLQSILERLVAFGIRVHVDPEINPKISASFEARDLQDGLASILKSLDHVFIWTSLDGPGGPMAQIRDIHVFRPGKQALMRPLQKNSTFAIARNPADGSLFVKNEMLVRLKPGITPTAFEKLLRHMGGFVLEAHPGLGLYRIRFPENTDIPAMVDRISKDPWVARAEPNYAYPLEAPLLGPPSSDSPDIETPGPLQASARIAVLDTGLAARSGVTDYIVASYDSLNPEETITDPLGHGTQMALIASGAVKPLGVQEESSMQNPIIAVRAFDDNGYTSNFNLISSIDYALENGARVMSLSWGSEVHSTFLENALDEASAKGLIVVASAGNEPTGKPVYPAAYPTVLGVGALRPDGKAWGKSNYGDFVTLYAPGFADLPVGYKGDPGAYAGTSISAAFVAGVIGNYLSKHPEATKQDVLMALRNQF